MDYEKIHKILIEIYGEQEGIEITTQVEKKGAKTNEKTKTSTM